MKIKRSSKGTQIIRIQNLIRDYLKKERGDKCELCGRKSDRLGVFHILPTSRFKRIRFNLENLLLSCWFPCHYNWHHDMFKAKVIETRIKELRGNDYENRLKILDKISPKMTALRLDLIEITYRGKT